LLSESPAFVRRILRFLALPYCYYSYINWEVCKAPRLRVIYDLFYIFFRLKYFPENYSLCHLWEKPRNEWKYYYGSIYDALQRNRLRKEVFPLEYRILFEDKNVCHQLCVANQLPVPVQFGIVNKNEIKNFLFKLFKNEQSQKQFIIKPLTGKGGKDIYLAYFNNGQIYLKSNNKPEIPINKFALPAQSVVQEYIEQHPRLKRISQSVNTVRIVTLLTHSKDVQIIGAYMRFGIEKAFLDNASQGGVAIGIKINTGKFLKFAHDFKSKVHEVHPTSGFRFEGFQVPLWNDVIELAQKTQKSFSCNKIIGHDIAITESGPIIIELNAAYDNISIEQRCGPILKDYKTLKAFDDYGLLFSNKQRALLKESYRAPII